MSELRELYQEVILDHGRRPRNFRKLEGANHTAEGHNPLCGDQITIYMNVKEDVIEDISFQGLGCAISMASASMMTTTLKGKRIDEAEGIFRQFHKIVTRNPLEVKQSNDSQDMGKLAVFSGVCEFPVRVKCATLPWHTFHAATEGKDSKVTTE